jgi:uncharacterized membrane protein
MFTDPALDARTARARDLPDCVTGPTSDFFEVRSVPTRVSEKTPMSISMRKAIAKAVTWRLIGTAEIFAISFWTTGHVATASQTAAIAAITSIVMYVAHEMAWR